MEIRRYLCAVCLPNAPDVIHGSPGARWANSWTVWDSNPGPRGYESPARIPTELTVLNNCIIKLVLGDALNCLLRPFYTANDRDYRRKPIVDIQDATCRNGPIVVSSSSPRENSTSVNFPGAWVY